jgi:hypothetical protein
MYLLRSCQGFLRKSGKFSTHSFDFFGKGRGLVSTHELPDLSKVYFSTRSVAEDQRALEFAENAKTLSS